MLSRCHVKQKLSCRHVSFLLSILLLNPLLYVFGVHLRGCPLHECLIAIVIFRLRFLILSSGTLPEARKKRQEALSVRRAADANLGM